jgi:hypothetical protein
MAGSTGVLPPPEGYLQRLRSICDRHGILLIFDEVITGFGRLGFAFAAERYGVTPDMICFAKGVTSGAVPLGGVIVREGLHAALMTGPERAIELFHGYTYSGHPLACAAGLATLDLYRDDGLFARARALEPILAEAVMGLRDEPNVLDIRTLGLAAGIDLAPRPDAPGARAYDAMVEAFHRHDLVVRVSGNTLAPVSGTDRRRGSDWRVGGEDAGSDPGGGLSGASSVFQRIVPPVHQREPPGRVLHCVPVLRSALLEVAVNVADDLLHMTVVVVRQVGLVLAEHLDDATAFPVARRLAAVRLLAHRTARVGLEEFFQRRGCHVHSLLEVPVGRGLVVVGSGRHGVLRPWFGSPDNRDCRGRFPGCGANDGEGGVLKQNLAQTSKKSETLFSAHSTRTGRTLYLGS